MQHIYSHASHMVVWLGEVEPWGLENMVDASNKFLESGDYTQYGVIKVVSNLLSRP